MKPTFCDWEALGAFKIFQMSSLKWTLGPPTFGSSGVGRKINIYLFLIKNSLLINCLIDEWTNINKLIIR